MKHSPSVRLTLQDPTFRTGFLAGLGAYFFWGFVPVYFKFLDTVAPLTVIAHRVAWSVLMLLVVLLLRDWRALGPKLAVGWRALGGLALSATFLACNWLVFVWAVVNDQILATSLGYFINPLLSVLLAMVFLGERLGRAQWLALALAAASTAFLGFYVGEPPWAALALAFSFGCYGLVRKSMTSVRPMIGLFWETLLLSPAALAYLAFLTPDFQWGGASAGIRWLLIGSGLVTILPLLAFNLAAQRLPLSLLGFMQYLGPTISFLIAIFIYHEPFSVGQAIAFGGIWVALIIFSLGGIRASARLEAEPAR